MKLSPNVEEYLEILWILEEEGVEVAKINEIAEKLAISPPSAVEMLKKMEEAELVEYRARVGISLNEKGREIARQVIRNHRLAEMLLTDILHMDIDESAICGLEHHISEEIADAVCTALNHPRRCPHGNDIPKGKCCKSIDTGRG
ncbi:MAG: metal-dependent transcriptional regulator [Candidatus Hydrothermarchaeales archaeon]